MQISLTQSFPMFQLNTMVILNLAYVLQQLERKTKKMQSCQIRSVKVCESLGWYYHSECDKWIDMNIQNYPNNWSKVHNTCVSNKSRSSWPSYDNVITRPSLQTALAPAYATCNTSSVLQQVNKHCYYWVYVYLDWMTPNVQTNSRQNCNKS